jgi:ATP-dependent HslUV protease ATP-binding subunit HslU
VVFYVPGDVAPPDAEGPDALPSVGRVAPGELTPAQVVEELDRHVVGQAKAKRAVAVAMRNRLRRLAVGGEIARDIVPKNILMIGPTGVGKTEIARRIARLTGSPFQKVEASKFTEVGYVGRDVESIVRDLVAQAFHVVREEQSAAVHERAAHAAEERLLDLLAAAPAGATGEAEAARRRRREGLREQLRAGHLDEREVEIEVTEPPKLPGVSIFSGQPIEGMDVNMSDLLGGLFPGKRKRKSLRLAEARAQLVTEETGRLVDEESLQRQAVLRVETQGIVFLDEIDKIAGREGGRGPDVSREGVQRDLLPIVEGTTVQTRWGAVRTDHVLFIAAGAFHVSKPSDLIPELQGRFPVRVELTSLNEDDFVRILREPTSSLTRQARALLATEGVTLRFTEDGLRAIARHAAAVNARTEDIGARRLHTILETVLEDLSFAAPDEAGSEVVIDAARVDERLAAIVRDEDWSRYVL